MLAVIKTGGKQYKVKVGDKIRIEKIEGGEGEKVSFPEVLFWSDGKDVKVGMPIVEGANVEGTILKQAKGDKVIIVKHKAKKRIHKKQGHRQLFTEVEIVGIKA